MEQDPSDDTAKYLRVGTTCHRDAREGHLTWSCEGGKARPEGKIPKPRLGA